MPAKTDTSHARQEAWFGRVLGRSAVIYTRRVWSVNRRKMSGEAAGRLCWKVKGAGIPRVGRRLSVVAHC
jgi:hypothetical protein